MSRYAADCTSSRLAWLGWADEVASALGVAAFNEELSYQGGALLPAHPVVRRADQAQRGPAGGGLAGSPVLLLHQLHGASAAHLLAVLRTLGIDEHDDGSPWADPERRPFRGPGHVLKQIPGLGLLDMAPLTRADRAAVLDRGSRPAGEKFRDALADGKPYFVLATADTWSAVPPADSETERVPDPPSGPSASGGGVLVSG